MSGIPPITPAPISPYGKLSMHARCLTCGIKCGIKGGTHSLPLCACSLPPGQGTEGMVHPLASPLTHPLTEIEGGRLGGIEGGAEGGIEGGI